MANKKVGIKTGKSTQAGRDVYKTEDGENVSEKSTTFEYKGQWINIPSIHKGYRYDDDTLRMMLDAEVIEPTSTHKNETDAVKAAVERSNNLKFNRGGTPMRKQMKLFNDGGLKEEGGMVDKESGNKVPVGGTRKGVRDDIPAMVSEGEFVFPEDVVRYIGLDKLMQMRQKAKAGLQNMDDMGQMGNSEEATVPDDAPLSLPVGMAEGGVVQNAAPRSLVGGVAQTAAPRQLTTTTPTAKRSAVSFKEFMGKGYVEFKEYRNSAGTSLLIPFVGGEPAYPIPSGYTEYTPTSDESGSTGGASQGTTAIATEVGNAINAATGNDKDDNNFTVPKSQFQKSGGWDMDTTGSDGKDLQLWIDEATKFFDGTSSVVSGVASVFGLGVPVYLLNKSQRNRVIEDLDEKIAQAKKTSMPGQVAALQKIKDSLNEESKKSILSKVVDGITGTIGDLFGADEEEKKKAVTEVVKIENETFNFGDVEGQYSKSPSLSTDLPGELSEPEFTSTANMPAATAKDEEKFKDEFDAFTRKYSIALAEVEKNLKPRDVLEYILKDASVRLGKDAAREIQSNSMTTLYNTDYANNTVANLFGPNFGRPKLSTEEQIAKRASITPSGGVPFSASTADPRLLEAAGYPVQTKEEQTPSFTPSTPSYDMFGKPYANATVRKYADDALADSSAFANTITEVNNLVKGYDFKTDLGPLPGVDPNFTLESTQQFTPKMTTEVPKFDVPSSPRNYTDTAYNYGTQMDTTLFPATVQDQTQQAFAGSTYDTVPAYSTKQVTDASSLYNANQAAVAGDPRELGGVEGYGQTGVAKDSKTFEETFAANRAAGAKEFSYDRDGDGKTERYTTDLAKSVEAAKAGSNSLYQTAANLFTPGDDKEYVGGELVDTVSKVKDPSSNKNSGSSGSSSGSSGSSSTKTTTTTTRTAAEIQKDINAEVGGGKPWTSKANDLVKERDAAKANESSGGGGGGGGSSSGGGGGCCFIMLEARYGNGTMDEVVRRYRDEYMTDRNRRGYYKLAEVLVPLMRKSKVFKWVVTKTFADPLVSYGKYYYGQGKVGVLYSPVKSFWMKVFNVIGGETEFIRENGEVV